MSLLRFASIAAAVSLVLLSTGPRAVTSMHAAGIPVGQIYSTSLSATQEIPVPVGSPSGSGTTMVRLNPAGDQITVQLSYTGMTSTVTGAHIHGSATPGNVAPVIFDLAPTGGTSGTNGATTFAVGPTELAILRSGRMYVNVHTATNPSGEIRGQLHAHHAAGDADGDGRTDLAVFRPSDTRWYLLESSTATIRLPQWGLGTDVPVPGDYDGDGRLDLAVFRPTDNTWYILNSATDQFTAFVWGVFGDIPVPGDFDGDSRTDVAVFRPSTADWWIRHADGSSAVTRWGSPGDRPAVADFDRDGRSDISVLRPGGGWWVLMAAGNMLVYSFGAGVDGLPLVPADYTGDGRADPAVFNPATGVWRGINSAFGEPIISFWGAAGDIPVPGDYDSDGKADFAVFRPSDGRWYIRHSYDNSIRVMAWGLTGDVPVPSMFTMPDSPPTAIADTATVNQDSGPTAVPVLGNDTDFDGGPRSVFAITQPANGIAAITGAGTAVSYQPNAGYCNNPPPSAPDTFTYTLAPGGTSATVSVTVTCGDDPPTAVADAATVNEDSGATAIDVLANDTDPDGGPIALASVTQPANGVVVITGGGTGLTYQPNADYCNTPPGTALDTFTYTLTPGTSSATVTVTVTCVDDGAVAVNDSGTVVEDASATAVDVLTNDTDADGGPKSIGSVTQPANGTVVITGGGTGLTYQPAANYCNAPPLVTPDTFTYTLTPGGSVGTVSMTVTCVNDAPVATDDPLSPVLEDSAPRTIAFSALTANDNAGPNESTQALTITAVSSPVGGTVSIAGTDVIFTLEADFVGTASFTYTLEDDGTTNGVADPLTDTGSVSFLVASVNDEPSFTIAGNPPAVNEDAGAQSVPGFATSISAGPGESGQVLTFVVSSNSNATLFSAGPAIAANGTLTYTPAANQNGTATIQVRLHDDGGTANGGDDQSPVQQFVITVNPVNDAPVAAAKNFAAQANMQIQGLTGFLTGITDADSGVNGCTPTFTLASVGATNPAGGAVTITDATTGTVTFEPPAGVTGNVTFTYTVQDNGCPGSATSAAATATVNVAGPVIWFVNSALGVNGTGTLINPFNNLASAAAVDGAGHVIFLYTGTYTTGITLNASESLMGQGAIAASFDALMGITPPAGTIARPSINGTRPTISIGSGTAVTLSTGNIVHGLNVANSNGSGITGAGVGTLTLANFDVTVTNGSAVSLTGSGTVTTVGTDNDLSATTGTALNVANVAIGAAGLTFKSVSASGGTNGIVLNTTGSSGGLTVTGNSSGSCGGSVTVNPVGTAATVGAPVTADCTGGTIQNSTGAGIVLSNVTNVSLTRMRILNSGTDGINALTVNGFTLDHSLITDSSGVAGDRGIEMGDFSTGTPVNGTINIANSTLGPTPHDNFGLGIASGTSAWNISHTVFTGSVLNSGFNIETRAATITSFLMDSSVSQNHFADGMQMQPASGVNSTISSATIQNSTFTGNNIGIDLNHDGTSSVTYKVLSNTFLNQTAQAVNFFSSATPGTGGTMNGRFVGNVIGNAATFESGGGLGLRININGGADATVLIDSNTIRQIPNGRGIEIISRNGTGGLDATVTNNSVDTDFVATPENGGFSLSNIFLQSNCLTVCNTLRSNVTGNSVPATPPNGELVAGQLVLIRSSASTNQLVDNAPVSGDAAAELASHNTGSTAVSGTVGLIAGPIDTPPSIAPSLPGRPLTYMPLLTEVDLQRTKVSAGAHATSSTDRALNRATVVPMSPFTPRPGFAPPAAEPALLSVLFSQ